MNRRALLALLEDDRDLLEHLVEIGVLPQEEDELSAEVVDQACVARTLVRELEVNWPGVEVVLHMRAEMLAMHRQVADLFTLLESWRREKNRS
jgi:hypothetical protein